MISIGDEDNDDDDGVTLVNRKSPLMEMTNTVLQMDEQTKQTETRARR